MTDNVVSLDSRRPHLEGPAKCVACQHEWRAVAPEGCFSGLECPDCGADKGVLTGEVVPNEFFQCNCGCDAFFLVRDAAQCRNCGIISSDWLDQS